MDIRRSRVLEKLRAGKTVSCLKLNLADPRSAQIAGIAGFDCVWTDMEHVPNDFSVIEQQITAAKVHDTDTLVRVAKGPYSDYIKPLEADAAGVMIPHVMSAVEAGSIVRTLKFQPDGLRYTDGGNADGLFGPVPFAEYAAQANRERFIMIQIEDPEPMEELDDICAVEGIDIIFFGPNDYSHALGLTGQWDHPDVLDAQKRVAECAVKHRKWAGTLVMTEMARDLVDLGYRFISLGSDTGLLRKGGTDLLAGLEQ